MALYRDLKPGDSCIIGDAMVTLESKSGQRARLRIDTVKVPSPTPAPAAAKATPAPVLRRPEEVVS
jgi:hypothetical protein